MGLFEGLGAIAGKIGLSDYTSGRDYGRQRHERRMAQAYSERMSNTAMQRGVKDLEAAGLNRVLAAGGQPASSPTSSGGGVAGQKAEGDILQEMQIQEQTKLLGTTGKKAEQETKESNQRTLESKQRENTNAETAKALKRENDYWDKNPTHYGIKKKMETLSSVTPAIAGGAMGAIVSGKGKGRQNSYKYKSKNMKRFNKTPFKGRP